MLIVLKKEVLLRNSPKLTAETVFEQADANGVHVSLWASRARSQASHETTYSAILTVGGHVTVEQIGLVSADGSAEMTTLFHRESGTHDALRLAIELQGGATHLKGDLNGKPIPAIPIAPDQFSEPSWTVMKNLPVGSFELVFEDGQPLVLPEMGGRVSACAEALVATIDAQDPNKLNLCALGVMAGAIGVAVVTQGAGGGLIIAAQLWGTAYCAMP